MSDPTKKSIVINKSFLSGSGNSNSSNVQKKSKKNTRNLSEELIKPNKLKKMLLDKINAKRKADQTSSPVSISGGGSNGGGGFPGGGGGNGSGAGASGMVIVEW